MKIIDTNADASLGPLMTIDEAAMQLRVHPATVRRRIASGELEAVRLGRGDGRSIRIPSRALEALLVPAVAERDE
jgi:excisionase family DNA binding protein